MSVTPQELRDAAQQAAANAGANEVERRAAASRTYYAAFHRCALIARSKPVFVGGTHAETIRALTKSKDRQVRGIGWRLEQCRQRRVRADYYLDDDFTPNDAQLITAECKGIWASAESVLGT